LGWLPPHFGQGSHPQDTTSYTYSNHKRHIMKFIKSQGYILGKKNCVINWPKNLVIFWIISIGHVYNFVFPIVTHDWLCSFLFFIFYFLWRLQLLATCYFDTWQAYILLLVQNRHTKYYLCIKYHLWYN
jgi:hypothetical protein